MYNCFRMKTNKKEILYELVAYVILLGCTFAICYIFFFDGMVIGDDYAFHTAEIYDCYVRMTKGNFGLSTNTVLMGTAAYGPNLFYAPFPHYFAAFLMYMFYPIGMNTLVAVKTTGFIFVLLSGIAAYALGKKMTKSRIGGLIMGVAFIFHPYRIFTSLCRAAFSESVAIAFIPVIFYGIYRILNDEKLNLWPFVVTIVGVSGIVLSHPFTALMTCGFAILFILFNIKKLIRILKNWKLDVVVITSVIAIIFLVSPYVTTMMKHMNSGMYRVSNPEIMWTNVDFVKDTVDSVMTFSGLLNYSVLGPSFYSANYYIYDVKTMYTYALLFYCLGAVSVVVMDAIIDMAEINKKTTLIVEFFVLFIIAEITHQTEETLMSCFIFYSIFAYYKLSGGQAILESSSDTRPIKIFKDVDLYFSILSIAILSLLLFVKDTWNYVPSIMYQTQFSWRLWSLFYFMVIFMAGVIMRYMKKVPTVTPIMIMGASMMFGMCQALPEKRIAYFYNNSYSTQIEYDEVVVVSYVGAQDEYMPKVLFYDDYVSQYENSLYTTMKHYTHWAWRPLQSSKGEYITPVFLTGSGEIEVTYIDTPSMNLKISVTSDDALIQMAQIFYYGYSVQLTDNAGKKTNVDSKETDGLISFVVPKGDYDVEVRYTGTTMYKITSVLACITVASMILACSYIAFKKIKKSKEDNMPSLNCSLKQ